LNRRFRTVPVMLAAVALLCVAGCSASRQETQVAAAVSLRPALVDLGGAYEARHQGVRVGFQFAASGVLVRQIAEGAPFDVVAFAGEAELARLEALGRILPGSRVDLASNRLVIVVPAGAPLPSRLEDLTAPEFERIALGTPSTVPAGRYARQALESAGLWTALEPRLIFTEHARQVIQYVKRGEVDAGVAYASDAATATGLDVAMEIPASLHRPILYPAAILTDARNPDAARRLLEFLGGSRGDVAFRRLGFGPPR